MQNNDNLTFNKHLKQYR